MQKLICLRLQGQPADDLIAGTLLAWYEAIAVRPYDEVRDAPRFQDAFLTLMRTCTQWPAPADLLAAMPAITGSRNEKTLKLTSEEAQRRGLQHCNEILARLGGSIEPPETRQ